MNLRLLLAQPRALRVLQTTASDWGLLRAPAGLPALALRWAV
jgi:hypothetical protein